MGCPSISCMPQGILSYSRTPLEQAAKAAMIKMTVNVNIRNDADLVMGSFCSAQEQSHHNNQPSPAVERKNGVANKCILPRKCEQLIRILKKKGHSLYLTFRWGQQCLRLLWLVLQSEQHRSEAEQITFECRAIDSLQNEADLCNEQLLKNFEIGLRMETDDGLKMEKVQVTA
jgi:hypothetical protein